MPRLFTCLSLLLCLTAPAFAADWYVNNDIGDDANDGGTAEQPMRTANLAIRKAKAGDTVHLANTGKLYRQELSFYGHPGGEEGKPVTLDGHNATLSGADPCPADGWEPYAGEILKHKGMWCRGMLIVDGQTVFITRSFNVMKPGEVCYMPDFFQRFYFLPPDGTKAGDHEVEVGQPDGSAVKLDPAKWGGSHSSIRGVVRYQGLKPPTWVKVNGQEVRLVEARDRLEPGQVAVADEVMYYRPPQGKKIAELDIECVIRGNGVAMNGNTKYVVVRNVSVQHCYNDGFNIHGNVTKAEFYNCNARDMGDEGFSAHDTCETLLDGAVYVNCDNGIANVNNAGSSITRNVILQGARSVGFLIQVQRDGTAKHTLENAILIDNPNQLSGGAMQVDNVLIVTTSGSKVRPQALQAGSHTVVKRLTAVGNGEAFRVGQGSQLSLTDSALADGQRGAHARWDAPAELLTLKKVLFGQDFKMQWGTKYPWKEKPMAEWLVEAGGSAVECQVLDLSGLNALRDGRMPATLPQAGCSRELVEKFVQYMASDDRATGGRR